MDDIIGVFDKHPAFGDVVITAGSVKVKAITTEGIPEGTILCIPPRKVNESIDELAERSAIIKEV